MDTISFYAPIEKTDEDQRMVYGYASTEALDSQGEIVKKDALKDAIADYMKFANIREMHQPSAVGKTKKANIDAKGLYIAAKVVDDKAWEKVKEGVYNGFSIGGRVKTMVDNEITGLGLSEISLVDRPANPEAVFDVWKMDGATTIDESETIEDPEVKKMNKDVYGADFLVDLACNLAMFIESEKYQKEDSSKLETALKNIKAAIVTELKEDEYFDDITTNDIEYAVKTLDLAKAEVQEEVVETEETPTETVEEPEVKEEATETTEEVAEPVETVEEPVKEVADTKEDFMKALEVKLQEAKMPTDEELDKALEYSEIEVSEKNRNVLKWELAGKIIKFIEQGMVGQAEADLAKKEAEKTQKETVKEVETVRHEFDEVKLLVTKLEKIMKEEGASYTSATVEVPPETPGTEQALKLLQQAVELLSTRGTRNGLTASEKDELENGISAGSERTSANRYNTENDIPESEIEQNTTTVPQKVDSAEGINKTDMNKKIEELEAKLEKLSHEPMPIKAVASYTIVDKFEGNTKDELTKAEKRADELHELLKTQGHDQTLVKEANELSAEIMRLRREVK